MPVRTHGLSRTRIYRIWKGMRGRCCNESNGGFERYGARGVTICDSWMDFVKFREWTLSSGYRDDLTIDRIDNDGGYNPGNCRWVPPEDQPRNRRTNVNITFAGETLPTGTWAARLGIPAETARVRRLRGLPPEQILTVGKIKPELSADVCREVRRRYHAGEPVKEIAPSLGIAKVTAWEMIRGGRRWAEVA